LVTVEFKLTAIEIDADFPIVMVDSVTFLAAVDSLFDAPSFKVAVLKKPFETSPPLIDESAAAVNALAEFVVSVSGAFGSKFPIVATCSATVLCSGAPEPSTVAASESAPPEAAEVDASGTAEGIINYNVIFLNYGH
jgi:hypothetical protein